MIEKIRITGYRALRQVEIVPHPKMNILVGDNEAGKSTVLEALALALTGRVNGRPAQEELNPFWFNQQNVAEFFAARAAGQKVAPPEITIEVFLTERPELVRRFIGAHNSEVPTTRCAGVTIQIAPDDQYSMELEEYFASTPEQPILPVEYYGVDWRTLRGHHLDEPTA